MHPHTQTAPLCMKHDAQVRARNDFEDGGLREEGEAGFVKCQLLTTRNIRSQKWMQWFHGGLDMQIEHHLFPMLPRHQLHNVAPRVRALAEKHGMPYTQLGFFEAIGVCLGELHRMSTAIAYSSIA